MEITTAGINKMQGKIVSKLQDSLTKFITSFEVNRKEIPVQIAIPHQTYLEVMGFYDKRPDRLTHKGVLIYDCNNPPEVNLCNKS